MNMYTVYLQGLTSYMHLVFSEMIIIHAGICKIINVLIPAVYHLMQTVDHVQVQIKKDKGKAVGTCAHVLALKPLG